MQTLSKNIKKIISKIPVLQKLYSVLHRLKREGIIRKEIKTIRDINQKSEEDVRIYQNKRLFDLLKLAYENTDYYKKLIDENGLKTNSLSDFKKMPILTKSIIKENTLELVNKKYTVSSLVKKNTGGSTGKPLELYCSTKAGLADYGYHFYQYQECMGYENGDFILGAGAVVVPEELRSRNIYWLEIGTNEPFGDYKLSILYLNEQNVQHYVNKVIELKPSILRGYPSLFDSLAQYIIANNIVFDFRIKGISLTSEICSENQRANIEKAFDSRVYFEYGHTEVSVLCHTSENHKLYMSYPSYGYVEVLNEDGTDTPIGEIGIIVATGFLNEGMPFIRYSTEDLGRVSYRNGGVVHFDAIIGRSQDFIFSKIGTKISISALTSWQHLNAFANIAKWQITQEKKGFISISIIKGENYTIKDEMEIQTKIQAITDVEIEFLYVSSIPRTKGGKHLFLIQKLSV